jgi:hypothetical protein
MKVLCVCLLSESCILGKSSNISARMLNPWYGPTTYSLQFTSTSGLVTVQKGRPCVPLLIQGIYTVTGLVRTTRLGLGSR